jgi:hypothetical protein
MSSYYFFFENIFSSQSDKYIVVHIRLKEMRVYNPDRNFHISLKKHLSHPISSSPTSSPLLADS